jgi:hypothetical protein
MGSITNRDGRWLRRIGPAQRLPLATSNARIDCSSSFQASIPWTAEGRKKRLNSAADFRAFDPLSQPEARFRQNAWESGMRNSVPRYG